MTSLVKKCLCLGLFGLFLLVHAIPGAARTDGKITDVKLSPDGGRVIIESTGLINDPTVFVADHLPPRLVLDFERTSLGDMPRTKKIKGKPIRQIRVGNRESGARVVLDFGRYMVPEHRVTRIGDCFIVFLGESEPIPGLDPVVKRERKPAKPRRLAKKKRAGSPRSQKWAPVPASSGARLQVDSARVIDGLIVLDVTDLNNPESAYRINLGVDLAQAGFNVAQVRRVKRKAASRPKLKREADFNRAAYPLISRGPFLTRGSLSNRLGRGPTRGGNGSACMGPNGARPKPGTIRSAVTGCAYRPDDHH
jgi:hypothetical protein